MSEATQMAEWDRIAWLCMLMPRFSDQEKRYEDFHPFRNSTGTSDSWDGKTTDVAKLHESVEYWSERLPKKLTPDEYEAAYQRFLRWQEAREEEGKLSIV